MANHRCAWLCAALLATDLLLAIVSVCRWPDILAPVLLVALAGPTLGSIIALLISSGEPLRDESARSDYTREYQEVCNYLNLNKLGRNKF